MMKRVFAASRHRSARPHHAGSTTSTRHAAFRARARAAAGSALATLALGVALHPAPLTAQTTGTITGVVRARITQQPLDAATLQLEGTTQGATTDAAGRFRIPNVAPGTYRVRATRIGYRAALTGDVLVSARRSTEIAFDLDDAPAQIQGTQIVAAAFARSPEVPTTSYRLSYEEVRRSPGAIGDVNRLIQALPGMITASDQRNDIIARGGSPVENITLVDNIEIPNLNHYAAQNSSGGPITMLNNELLQDVTFLAGGFPSRVGNRLSAILDLTLREGNRERRESETDISFAGAGLITEGPLGARNGGRANGSYILSGRRSYLDLLAGPFGLPAIPNYWNWQGKATYDLGVRDRVSLLALGGIDDITFNVDTTDLDEPSLEGTAQRGWRAAHGGTWRHLFGGGYGLLTLSDFRAGFRVTVRDRELDDQLTFRNRSLESEQTVKYDLMHRVGVLGELSTGVSWKRMTADLAIDQPLGAANPLSANAARVDTLALDRTITTSITSGFAQLSRDVALGARSLTITAGVRAEHFDFFGATRWSPRGGVVLHVTPSIDVSASAGRYFQQVPLVYAAAVPSNASLAPMRADHLVGGVAWTPRADLRLSIEAFAKSYADYPVAVEYPTLSLANTGDVFGVGGLLFPMTSRGTGRAEGIELFAQKKFAGAWYGQASGTWSRTRHRALDGVSRRGAFDVPFTGTAIIGRKIGNTWEWSSRFSYATGRPYTPPLVAPSVAQNRLVLDLARVNAERTVPYARWDARVDRRFRLAGRSATTYLEIQNLLNRENVFQFVWNPKRRELAALNQIAFLPVGGFNLEF
ncbi:MAG: TonB-dependent receptor [Gemmatimonadaceae bacterium]|nr:TonB-dependent receptor [Gemmatimonadaceae bacterium]